VVEAELQLASVASDNVGLLRLTVYLSGAVATRTPDKIRGSRNRISER
jgi:hypothetical protein